MVREFQVFLGRVGILASFALGTWRRDTGVASQKSLGI
jgi:hypothetical protein